VIEIQGCIDNTSFVEANNVSFFFKALGVRRVFRPINLNKIKGLCVCARLYMSVREPLMGGPNTKLDSPSSTTRDFIHFFIIIIIIINTYIYIYENNLKMKFSLIHLHSNRVIIFLLTERAQCTFCIQEDEQ